MWSDNRRFTMWAGTKTNDKVNKDRGKEETVALRNLSTGHVGRRVFREEFGDVVFETLLDFIIW